MSDEKNEQIQGDYEMSATPFNSAVPEEQEEENITMEQAMAELDQKASAGSSVRTGEVIEGVVVQISKDGVLVDVGMKSEGTIPLHELSGSSNVEPEELVSIGEKIKVYVLQRETSEGGPLLSKKRADFESAWDKVEKNFTTGQYIKAMVVDQVKGGLIVDLGVRGFVPASHVGNGKSKSLDKFIGQSLSFKVIEIDRERRKVVLSNRIAVEEEQKILREKTWSTISEGQIKEGIVRRITDYGAFVDLGGVDGLLHVSEMSWTRIKHPSDAVKVGQKIQVYVLKIDTKTEKVSLSLRQILPDPWENVKRKYHVGDLLKVKVTRLVPFGAFCEVESGVEAIIPNSELSTKRISKPEEVVSVGDELEVKIIDVRAEERRMSLSARQLQQEVVRVKEAKEYKAFVDDREQAQKTTIGDLLGMQLGDFAENMKKKKKKEAKVKEPKKTVEEPAAQEVAPAAEVKEEAPVIEETVEEPIKEEVTPESPVIEEPVTETVAEEAACGCEAAEQSCCNTETEESTQCCCSEEDSCCKKEAEEEKSAE